MGFFNDLKEDLTQAVNELAEDTVEKEMQAEESKLAEEVSAIEDENTVKNEEPSTEELTDLEQQLKEYLEADTLSEEADASEEDEEADETETTFDSKPDGHEDEKSENDKAIELNPKAVIAETIKKTEAGKGAERRMDNKSKNVSDETAIITAGMVITGDICSEGSMDVIGSIVGNIDILGKLNITGTIQGDSKAVEIYAESAKITGEVNSESSVKIGQNSVVIGNIIANSAVIAGAVKGDIDVHGPVILDTSAIVMGNIKSRSVQINNGAVVEGMCSQCYAEVNPSSFFDNIGKDK